MKTNIYIPILGALIIFSACFFMGNFKESNAAEGCAHEYLTEEIEATCTEQGYTCYTCVLCGDSKKDNFSIEI